MNHCTSLFECVCHQRPIFGQGYIEQHQRRIYILMVNSSISVCKLIYKCVFPFNVAKSEADSQYFIQLLSVLIDFKPAWYINQAI